LLNQEEIMPGKIRRMRNSLSRDEILDAAEQIVRQEGIARLSMRNIADKLSCSVASPYAHFENLEEIIKSLIMRGEVILTGMLKEAVNSSKDSYEELGAIARAYWKFAQENKELHKLMFHSGDGLIHRKVLNVMPISYRVFLSMIKKGLKRGDFHVDRHFYPSVARTMWSWIYGLMVLDLTGVLRTGKSKSDPLEEGIAIFSELLRSGWRSKDSIKITRKNKNVLQ
jgi:AcrR family transcriptional regulator